MNFVQRELCTQIGGSEVGLSDGHAGEPPLYANWATNGLLFLSWTCSSGVRLQQSKSLACPSWQDIPNAKGPTASFSHTPRRPPFSVF